jgi:hypothetical protein
MDDWSKRRLNLTMPVKNILRGQEAFENHLARFCAPIGWLPSLDAPTTKLKCKTGTCALVDTGKIKAFVTCEHVWSQWKKYKHRHPNAELLIGLDDGPALVTSDAELIACDAGCDLAVLKAEAALQQMLTKAFYRIEDWPIPQPKIGDVVAIIGFAGSGRILTRSQVAGWSINFIGCRVSGVTPRDITLAPERKNDRMCYDENWNEIPHGNIGGMSGSPAFLLKEQGAPQLIGFLRAGRTSDDFIFLTPARFLQLDGKLQDLLPD